HVPPAAGVLAQRHALCVPEPVLAACQEMRAKWSNRMRQRYAVASSSGQTVAHPASPGLHASVHLVQRSTSSITKPIFRVEFAPTHGPGGFGAKRGLAV